METGGRALFLNENSAKELEENVLHWVEDKPTEIQPPVPSSRLSFGGPASICGSDGCPRRPSPTPFKCIKNVCFEFPRQPGQGEDDGTSGM